MRLLRLLLTLGIGIASTVTIFGNAASSAATVYSPPADIATDCSVNVSPELQAFLRGVPDGATIELPANACYRIDKEIQLGQKTGWTLDGRGATLRRFTLTPTDGRASNNGMLRFVDLADSTISGLNIRGINTVSDKPDHPTYGAWTKAYGFEHAFSFLGAQNVTLRDATVDAVFGDGVYIGGSDRHPSATGMRVVNVTIDRNGRQGISVTSATNVLLDGVTIAHSRRSGLDLEPHPGKVVSGVELRNSTINAWLLAISGVGVGKVTDVNVHDNRIVRSGMPFLLDRPGGKNGEHRTGWRVVDNVVTFTVRSTAPMIAFGNTSQVLVQGNVFAVYDDSRTVVSLGVGSSGTVRCNVMAGGGSKSVIADSTSSFVTDSNSFTSARPTCGGAGVPTATPTTSTPTATATTSTPTATPTTSTPTATPTPTGTVKKTKVATTQGSCRDLVKKKAVRACVKAKQTCRAAPGRAHACVQMVRTCHAIGGKHACARASAKATKKCRGMHDGKAAKCGKAVRKAHSLAKAAKRAVIHPRPVSYDAGTSGRAWPGAASLIALGAIWAFCLAMTRQILATPSRSR